jgi:hypothetical protein
MGKPDTAGRIIAGLLGYGAEPAGSIAPMIAARRRIVDQPVETVFLPGDDKPVKVPAKLRYRQDRGLVSAEDQHILLDQAIGGLSDVNLGSIGVFAPTVGTKGGFLGVAVYPSDARSTRRHEIMHGYNLAARRGMPGMPLPSRAIAAIKGGYPMATFRGGVATALDELAAQRAGGTSFADVPWHIYADLYRQWNAPWAARTAQALDVAGAVRRNPGKVAVVASAFPAAYAAGTAAREFFNGDEDQAVADPSAQVVMRPQRWRETVPPPPAPEEIYRMRRPGHVPPPPPPGVMSDDELIERLSQ